MNDNKKRLIFLFGAGISTTAGLPTGMAITESLIKYVDYFWDGSQRCIKWGKNLPCGANYSKKELEVIQYLYTYLKENGEPFPNYERIFYLARMVSQNIIRMGKDNSSLPSEWPLKTELYPFFKQLPYINDYDPTTLYMHVCNYIEFFIIKELSTDFNINDVSSKLSVILDACKSDYFDEIIIFTLNHDIVLEKIFYYNKIDLNDGFSKSESDRYFYWDESKLYERSKVKLIKLHGSIKWYLKSGFQLVNEIHGHNTNSNDFIIPNGMIPFFITGTDNKYFDYTYGYTFEMLNYFYRILMASDKLFVSGYGFCDYGINNFISHVQNFNKKLKTYVISKNTPQTHIRFVDQDKSDTRKYIQDFKFEQLKKLYDEE